MQEEKAEQKKSSKIPFIIIGVLIVVIILLLIRGCASKNSGNSTNSPESTNVPIEIDQTEGDHVDALVQYNRNITLPGWGALRINANATTVETIEFPNPEENAWSEANFSIGDKFYRNQLVGDETYQALAAIIQSAEKDNDLEVKSVDEYDETVFELDDKFGIRVTKAFDDEKTIVLTDSQDKQHTITVSCVNKTYYMSFALYLGSADDKDNAELLYQSKLVTPGKSLSTIELAHGLPAGTYEGFVFIQPYYEDQATPTNSGLVKLTLIVE